MALASLSINAQGLPQPSPAASFSQTVGVTNISMDYSRPNVKGRTIWGDLVPYGKAWRAGANSSTKIEFSTDVTINNVLVPAGKYAVYVIPTEKDWTFIISNYVDGWGVGDYTKASDIVRVTATPKKVEMTQSLMYSVNNISDNSCEISLTWEMLSAGFLVNINTTELAGKVVEKTVADADNSFRAYNDAAKWYLANNNAVKAVDLAKKSVSQTKKFWNLTVLSEAYYAAGDKKMAIKTAKEALEMSEKAEYMPYVKRNAGNIEMWEAKK